MESSYESPQRYALELLVEKYEGDLTWFISAQTISFKRNLSCFKLGLKRQKQTKGECNVLQISQLLSVLGMFRKNKGDEL